MGARVFRAFRNQDLAELAAARGLSEERARDMRVVAEVLPFRVNTYVLDELIDWDDIPDDPIFQLTFPQKGMLETEHFSMMKKAFDAGLHSREREQIARRIRLELNPHPADQIVLNMPRLDGAPVPGVQRKYRETALIFPAQGQTCHSYCSFCFRWPQFKMKDLTFATDQAGRFASFIRREKELTDVLLTGGDPMVMRASILERYITPLLGAGFEHIRNIRIGTKSVAYWPHRFVTDRDADDVLRLFERVAKAGKTLAIMAHYDHPRELSTDIAQDATRRIRRTGAVIRTQSPLVRHINDDPAVWAELWRTQVKLGLVPYYMFVARDTGARRYFEVPLVRAWEIFRGAYRRVSGLARTVRGPSMSASPGKVLVEGVAEHRGEPVFVLSFLQARNPNWVRRPFFAAFDPTATWFDDLVPASDESEFFFRRRGAAA
jgi:KamA family protein